MVEALRHFDYRLFQLVNTEYSNLLLDIICPVLREKLTWTPFYAVIVYWFFRLYGRQVIFLGIMAAITIVLSDYLSAHVIKPYIHRLRPCNNPNLSFQVRLLLEACGSGYSFVSAHAANHFALATFLSFLVVEKHKWVPLFYVWAFSIAFSQVYVGVHYPADVAGGAMLGTGIGLITGGLARWKTGKISNHHTKDNLYRYKND